MQSKKVEAEIRKLLRDVMKWCEVKRESKEISKRVRRGRMPSIANELEDRFAVLLERVLPKRYSMAVDQPISYRPANQGRAKISYPDVAIVRDSSLLVGIIELKVDLGYTKREWVAESKRSFRSLRKVRTVEFRTESGTTNKTTVTLEVARDLHRAVVIMSGKNDHGKLPLFMRQKDSFVLSSNVHPKGYEINSSNQERFLKEIAGDSENRKNWRAFAKFLRDSFR